MQGAPSVHMVEAQACDEKYPPMTRAALLGEVKARLQAAFGERFRELILYGSEARGDATPDSDIDLMLLLHGPIRLYADTFAAQKAIYDLQCRYNGRVLHIMPDTQERYLHSKWPLYIEVRKEGVAA